MWKPNHEFSPHIACLLASHPLCLFITVSIPSQASKHLWPSSAWAFRSFFFLELVGVAVNQSNLRQSNTDPSRLSKHCDDSEYGGTIFQMMMKSLLTLALCHLANSSSLPRLKTLYLYGISLRGKLASVQRLLQASYLRSNHAIIYSDSENYDLSLGQIPTRCRIEVKGGIAWADLDHNTKPIATEGWLSSRSTNFLPTTCSHFSIDFYLQAIFSYHL